MAHGLRGYGISSALDLAFSGSFDYSVRFLTFFSFGSWFISCYFQPHTHTTFSSFYPLPMSRRFCAGFYGSSFSHSLNFFFSVRLSKLGPLARKEHNLLGPEDTRALLATFIIFSSLYSISFSTQSVQP